MNNLKIRLDRVELELRAKQMQETAIAWRELLEQDQELLKLMMGLDIDSKSDNEQREFFDFCIRRTFDRVDGLELQPIPSKWLKAM